MIEPESFRDSLPVFMRNPVLLFNHDRDLIVGRITRTDIDSRGLVIDAEFDMADEFAKARAGQVERGFLRGFSVGFLTIEEPKLVNGKLRFTKNRLLEISLVSIPANPHALIAHEADDDLLVMRKLGERMDVLLEERSKVLIEQLRSDLRVVAAEEVEERIGTVGELGQRIADKKLADAETASVQAELRALRDAVRIIEPPVTPDDMGSGGSPGGGGGAPAVAPGNPYAPPGGPGGRPAGGDGGGKARPIEGTLVPEFTAPDEKDKHRHRINVLREDGSGETQVASGAEFLPHSHDISGWVVVERNVAGKVSKHPGSLYPGEQLQADDPVVRELQARARELGIELVRATITRPRTDSVEDALDQLRFMFAD